MTIVLSADANKAEEPTKEETKEIVEELLAIKKQLDYIASIGQFYEKLLLKREAEKDLEAAAQDELMTAKIKLSKISNVG